MQQPDRCALDLPCSAAAAAAGGHAASFTANIELPLVVETADALAWDDSADLIVVGFGGAGVVTALQALEDGADVLAVDRFTGGGATEKSGGVVYAGGTRHQRAAGFADTGEAMFRYLKHEGTPVSDATLRQFCETSAANLEWIAGFGVPFGSTFYEPRVAYPPDGYFLYYTGMEKFRIEVAAPAPRGHRTVGKGATGRNYFAPLRAAAMARGLRFRPHAPVRRLIQDRDGRVIGVEVQVIPPERHAEHVALYRKVDPYKFNNGAKAEQAIAETAQFEAALPQQRQRLRARAGVVLAAGGYNYNLALFGRYRPIVHRSYRDIVRGGSMGCDGSGIELGVSAGGALSHMDRMFCTKAVSPPEDFVAGVVVNSEGQRFIAEDSYVGNVGCAVSEQPNDGVAWLIIDARTYRTGLRQLLWPPSNAVSWWGMPALLNLLFGGTRKARTLTDLARQLGLPAGQLEATIAEYNRAAELGQDPAWSKLSQHLRLVGPGPWRAINLSMRNKWGFSGTMPYGGLTVDETTGGVRRADGRPIAGLYAAGRTAVGVCSEANFSGLSIADTIFSGRRAARSALRHNQPAALD